MGSGHIVYQGPIKAMNAEFKKLKLGVPPRTNLADHVMLLVQTRELSELPSDDSDAKRGPLEIVSQPVLTPMKSSTLASFLTRAQSWVSGSLLDDNAASFLEEPKSGFGVQLQLLIQRELRSLIRDPVVLLGRYGVAAFLGVLLAIIFMGAGNQASPS